uniref:Uncharacterized protein n=1 Tax=Kalanchoe fedtschenkoi TaxID=63787 RepID=A0A7N0VLD8_KALFE
MMDKVSSALSIARTKSDQLLEMASAALRYSSSTASNEETPVENDGGTTPLRKPHRRTTSAGSKQNTHIRKSRSAQMKFDLDEVSSGAALSRASSASLGFSFSFTGFTVPPDEIADSRPFSDDEIRK